MNIKHNIPLITENCINKNKNLLYKNEITNGIYYNLVNKKLKEIFNIENSVVSSGTEALFLIIKILRPKRIWIPEYSCISLTRAANLANYKPIYYNNTNLNINKNDLLIIVNTFGKIFFETNEIKNLEKSGVFVVEDITHGYSITEKIRSKIAFSSYGYTKLISSFGSGVIFGKIAKYINYGDKPLNKSIYITKPNNLTLQSLYFNLNRINEIIKKRKYLAKYYDNELKNINRQDINLLFKFESYEIPYRYCVYLDNSKKFSEYLKKNKIESERPIWIHNKKINPFFSKILSLPFHESLNINQINFVVSKIYDY